MRAFHRTMGYLSGIFLLIIVLSITISNSYMQRNNISLRDLLEGTTNLTYNNRINVAFDGFWKNGKSSSSFKTITIEENETFDLPKELFVSATLEEIQFIEEDRDNIQVDYFRELPDTELYKVNYTTTVTTNKLSILASMSARNISINKDYIGSIIIHVPTGYVFDKLTLESSAAKIRNANIYSHATNLSIIASFGDIDIITSVPLENVNITSSLGSIKIENQGTIKELYIDCDLGEVELTIIEPISQLRCESNLGDIEITAASTIDYAYIHNNMGKLEATFQDTVGSADFYTNMGSISADFSKNDSMQIYADANLGSVKSDFPIGEKGSTDFEFISNFGSIDVKQK